MTDKSKVIQVIKKIRQRQDELFNQFVFCKDHNFNLEAEKFKALEDELRRIAHMLENEFDTGYISPKQS